MEPTSNQPDPTIERIEAVVQQTRQAILDGVDEMLQRQLEPALERTRATILASTDAILREQAEPFLLRARQLLMEMLEEMVRSQLDPLVERVRQTMFDLAAQILQSHAGPLVSQVKAAFHQTIDELLQQQVEPALKRAQAGLEQNVPLAAKFTDAFVSRLKAALAEPAGQVFRQHVPEYAQWAGRRVLDYVMGATLFVLAAIFLLLGGVLGLQELGLPRYATYLIGGLVSLAAGFVFLKLWKRWGGG